MKPRVKVTKQRHFKPHAEFYHATTVLLDHVEKKYEGHYYSLLSSLMMAAFTFEAYMNYVGPLVEPGWSDFDKASTLGKFRHISLKLSYKTDFSKRPCQSIRDLFLFRNRMAHPRDEKLKEEYIATVDDYQEHLYSMSSPKWLAIATEKNARRCVTDLRDIMENLNSRLPNPDISAMYIDGGSGHASMIRDEKGS